MLLVDDLSVLLSLGAAPVDVLDFIHYCRMVVCSQLKVPLSLHTKGKPGFLFVPLCTIELQKALSLQEVRIFTPGPFLGSCISPQGTLCNWFPGGAVQSRALGWNTLLFSSCGTPEISAHSRVYVHVGGNISKVTRG